MDYENKVTGYKNAQEIAEALDYAKIAPLVSAGFNDAENIVYKDVNGVNKKERYFSGNTIVLDRSNISDIYSFPKKNLGANTFYGEAPTNPITNVRKVYENALFGSTITNLKQFVYRCQNMTEFTCFEGVNFDMADGASYIQAFGVNYNLEKISMPPIVAGLSTQNFVQSCSKLTTIVKCYGLISRTTGDTMLDFGSCPLTRESAVKLIEALDPDNVGQMRFSKATYESLTEDDIALIPTGWEVLKNTK